MSDQNKISEEYLQEVKEKGNEIRMYGNFKSRRLKDLLYELSLYHGCDIKVYRYLQPINKQVEDREEEVDTLYMYFYHTMIIEVSNPEFRIVNQVPAISPKEMEEKMYRSLVDLFIYNMTSDIEEL